MLSLCDALSFSGVREAFNPHAVLEVLAVSVGQVQIRFVETGMFLSMGPEGRLYGTKNPSNMDTVFVEKKLGPYLTYLNRSHAHLGWHVGIQQNGQPKNGTLTAYPWGQKAVSFVSRRPYAEHHPVRQLQNRHGFKLAVRADGKGAGAVGVVVVVGVGDVCVVFL